MIVEHVVQCASCRRWRSRASMKTMTKMAGLGIFYANVCHDSPECESFVELQLQERVWARLEETRN